MAARPQQPLFASYLQALQIPDVLTASGRLRTEPLHFTKATIERKRRAESKRVLRPSREGGSKAREPEVKAPEPKKIKRTRSSRSVGSQSSVGSVISGVGGGGEEHEPTFVLEEEKNSEAEQKALEELKARIPPLPPERFSTKPEDMKFIAKGAYGDVYVTKNLATNETIVVKKLRAWSASAVRKIIREAEILRHLESSCKPYFLCGGHLYRNNGEYWVVTEFLGDYDTMGNVLEEEGAEEETVGGRAGPSKPSKPSKAGPRTGKTERAKPKLLDTERMFLSDKVMFAIGLLHRARVAHRDIKPDNIMISKDHKNIKIIDFGEACCDICPTTPGGGCREEEVVGSPLYMAPEVLAFGPDQILLQDPSRGVPSPTAPLSFDFWQAADLWSTGITLLQFNLGLNNFAKRILNLQDPKARESQRVSTLLTWVKSGIPGETWLDLFKSHYARAAIKTYVGERIIPLLEHDPARRLFTLFTK